MTQLKVGTGLGLRSLVIDFWASWCEPCKNALPHYNKLSKAYKYKNVLFVGINEDDDTKERDAALKLLPLEFPVYQDKYQEFAKKFMVQALPTLFFLNRQYQVVARFQGFKEENAKQLEELLGELSR